MKTTRQQYQKSYQQARIAYNFRIQTGVNYWEFSSMKILDWCNDHNINWEIYWEAAQAIERLNWGRSQFNPTGNYPRLINQG